MEADSKLKKDKISTRKLIVKAKNFKSRMVTKDSNGKRCSEKTKEI